MHLEPGSGQWSLPDWGNGPAAAAGGTQGVCVLVQGHRACSLENQ